jgi:NAD(P)-dependent dehydrogenase (short-subunit alcohol dehydrogenase family)
MEVVEEIKAMGGEAVADGENVADFAGAGRMVQRAIDTFGRLDTLVNNAGILRDRMLTNMEESEWDAVIAVHLKGVFAPTRHAAAYWREQTKAGTPVAGRVVNTSSPSGLFGNAGQTNYGAAKAGVAAFTIICGLELVRYGVCANAIAHLAGRRVARFQRQRRRERPRVPRRRRPGLGRRGLEPRSDRAQRPDALGAVAADQGHPRPGRTGPAQLDDALLSSLPRKGRTPCP